MTAKIICMWCMLSMVGGISPASERGLSSKESNRVYGPLTERKALKIEVRELEFDIARLKALKSTKALLITRSATARLESLDQPRRKSEMQGSGLQKAFHAVVFFNALEMLTNQKNYKKIFFGKDENGRNFLKRVFRDKDTAIAAVRLFGPAVLWFFLVRHTKPSPAAMNDAETRYQDVLDKVAAEDAAHQQQLATLVQKYEGDES